MHDILAVLCFASVSQSTHLLFGFFSQVQMKTTGPDFWWSQRKGYDIQSCIITPLVPPTLRNSSMPGFVARVHSSLVQEGGCCRSHLRLEPTSVSWTGQELIQTSICSRQIFWMWAPCSKVQAECNVGYTLLVVAQGQGIHLTHLYRCLLGLHCTDATQFWNHDHKYPKTKCTRGVAESCLLTPIQHPTALFSTPWRPSHNHCFRLC